MLILSILSSIILLWIIYTFIRKNGHDLLAIIGLLLKIATGISLGLIYKFHYQGGDTLQYFADAGIIVHNLLENPRGIFALYFDTSTLPEVLGQIAYSDQPRALFFTKIVSLLHLLTGGNYWIAGAYLSIINFLCTYLMVREITSWYPDFKKFVAITFYFLPTFIFWTSGLLKESLAVGALFILILLILKMVRGSKYLNFPYWILIVFSAWLLWELKYFYAAVALPLLFSLLIYSYINQKTAVPFYLLFLFFMLTLLAATQFHYNLSLAHVSDVIYQNYLLGVDSSETRTLKYFHFDGSWLGFLINLPMAAIFGLFRPLVFEASNFLQALVGLENMMIFILLIVGIWKSGLKITWRNPVLLITLIYIILLDVMIAFSTPNFGTLSRYKVGYWPFFVMLVLILYVRKKQERNS